MLWAQQTEDDIRKEANDLFEKERYVEATPLYLRLLSLNPKDYDYNFKYGTCLLFNSNQKSEGLRYLNFAVKNPGIDPRAYYFRGKALHLDYQFDQAKKSYQKYLNIVGHKADERYNVEREIEMCDNGKRLLTTFTDIIVADKKEIDQDKFFRIYTDVETIGGNILVAEMFQSKIDKKRGHIPVVHFPDEAKAVYYSSYGDDGDTGLDIYIRRRLPDGTWGIPEKLPGDVNTDEDEDFPYMHPSGRFLYFSSKGHNSMGGYDVFMSRYRESSNDFGPPENVDFAISSPDDDLFYVVDSLFQNAYFASARQSENGKLHVYRVKVARVPIQEVIIMGDFESTINPQSAQMFIKLKNFANGEQVAETETNQENKYAIVFPQGGKYEYEITITTSQNEHKFVVEIPFLEDFRPLKQKIIHTMENGEEVVKVINMFDEKVEGAEEIIAQVIRKKAELEVNIDNFDLEALEAEQKQREMLSELGYSNMRMDEIADQLEELKQTQEANEVQLEIISSNVQAAIIKRAEQIKQLDEEQQALEAKLQSETDPIKKHELLTLAKQKELQKRALGDEIKALNEFESATVAQMTKGSDANVNVDEINNRFNDLVDSGDEYGAIKYLHEHKADIDDIKQGTPEEILQQMIDERVKLKSKLDDTKATEAKMNKQIKDLQTNINVAESKLQTAKKKEAEQLRADIERMKREVKTTEEERKYVRMEKDQQARELNKLDSQISTMQEAVRMTQPVAVEEEALKEALAESEKIPSSEEATQYDQEIAMIEEDHPELASATYTEKAEAELSLNDIRSEGSSNEQKINANSSLSEEQKLEQLVNNTESVLDKLQERIDQIEEELAVDPENNVLKDELTELEDYKRIQENKLDNYKNELEQVLAEQESPELAAINSDAVQEEFNPEYNNQLEEIQNDNSLTELGRTEEEIKVQKDAVQNFEEALDDINQQLADNPEDKTLQKKKNVLENLIEETNQDIARNEEKADNLIAEETGTVSSDQVLNDVDDTYNDRRSEIEDGSMTAEEKNAALADLDKELVQNLEDRKAEVESKLEADPGNQKLEDELEIINDLISDKNNEIAQLESGTSSEEQWTQDALIADIAGDYNEQVNAINASTELSDLDKQEQLKALDEELIEKATDELADVEKKLSRNPDDAALVSKKEALEQLIAEKQEKLAEREQIINALQGETSVVDLNAVKENVMNEIDPDYNDVRSNIMSSSQDELAAIDQLIQLEEDLIADLKTKEKALEKALKKDPENKEIQNELNAVQDLITEHEQTLAELESKKETVAARQEVLANSSDLINELYPEYSDNVAEISSDQAQSDFMKVSSEQREDQELLGRVENELDKVNEALQNDPGNKDLIERKEQLEQLKEVLESRIDERVEELASISEEAGIPSVDEMRENIMNSVAGDYDDKVQRIKESGLSEVEQAELMIELEKDVLSALKDEREKLLSLTERDPNNEEALTRLNVVNELIAESEARIEEYRQIMAEKEQKEAVFESAQTIINELLPEYSTSVNAVNNNSEFSELEKLNALQDLDEQLLREVRAEKAKVEEQLLSDPENEELQQRLESLKDLEEVLSTEIARRADEIAAIEASEQVKEASTDQRASVLADVAPDYESSVAEINNSSASEFDKAIQLLELENSLKESLMNEMKELDKQLSKDPENESLQERLMAVQALLSENDERIRSIKETLTESLASSELAENLLADIDPNYKNDIQSIEESGSETAFIEIAERENALQNKLDKEIEDRRKKLNKKYSVEVELELMALESMKAASEAREAEARDKNAALASGTSGEQEAFVNDIREELLGTQKDLITQNLNSRSELAAQDEALALYEEQLQEKITALENDPELSTSAEKQQELEWLKEELATVQSKRRSIEISIGELESETIAGTTSEEKYIADVREELLGRHSGEMDNNYTTKDELEQQDALLSRYEKKLNDQIDELKADPELATSEEKQEQLAWLESELDKVQEKRRSIKVSIGELETEVVAVNEEAKDEFITEQRQELLGEHKDDLEQEYTSKGELEQQDARLEEYEQKVSDKIEELKADPELASSEEKQEELSWLEDELNNVQKKRRSISISIGELETEVVAANQEAKNEFITEQREELLGEHKDDMQQEYSTKDELEQQDARLEEYEQKLTDRIESLESDPELSSSEEKKEELAWLEEERGNVQKKRKNIYVTIGELTTEVLADTGQEDPVLNDLAAEENKLENVLNDENASKAEKRQAEKRLEQVNEEQAERETELVTEELNESRAEQESVQEELNELVAEESTPALERLVETSESEKAAIEAMEEAADNADSPEEKKYILEQAVAQQNKLNDEIEEVVNEEKVNRLEEEAGVNLTTKEELERKKRKFMVDIGDLTMEIDKTKKQIETADESYVPALEARKESLESQRSLLEQRLNKVNQQLASEQESVPVISDAALDQEVTFNEERKLASTEEYKTYEEKASEALELEEQIATLENDLNQDKRELTALVERSANEENDAEIKAKVEEIKQTQSEIDQRKVELVQKRYEAEQALPENEEQAMKLQNLALRGVKPIQTTAVAVALLNLPTTGLAIDESAESAYSEANPIPVEVKAPKGLVYRVQIGAFRKAIPQDLFSEFNPVSGEAIGSTGITRYMAGYFASSDAVVQARETIRGLGYSDAFVVAYCDGKRVGFGDARRMEAAGTCVPQGENKLMLEVAANTAEAIGLPVENVVEELPDYSYAQAPGAAPSQPIELTTGLFFTVQIGVFSKPISRKDILGMEELFTIRLPNGTIRYNTGMFNTVDDAIARKKLANDKGLKAFVTAYFEGERISIQEAEALLAQRGTSILQTNIAEGEDGKAPEYEVPEHFTRTDTVTAGNKDLSADENFERIQIVTKKSFDEFPRDILNRYNARGTFYFDHKDGKVKSVIVTNPARLPRVYKFRQDIDTVYVDQLPQDTTKSNIIRVKFREEQMAGDFMDWLLRFNYRREFERVDTQLELRLYGVEPENTEMVMKELRSFGYNPEVVELTEDELQLQQQE